MEQATQNQQTTQIPLFGSKRIASTYHDNLQLIREAKQYKVQTNPITLLMNCILRRKTNIIDQPTAITELPHC